MEFNLNRGSQPAARPTHQSPTATAPSTGVKPPHQKTGIPGPAWLRVIWVVLLFAVTILVLAIAVLLYFGGSKEGDYVDGKKQQAVFLTNGQVYFGHIKSINKQYIDLNGIYYLNVNQQVQPKDAKSTSDAQNSISLVKLGCELHGPVDRMLINRGQVTFWENLRDDGQVAQAIGKWKQQYPQGQKCNATTGDNSTPAKP